MSASIPLPIIDRLGAALGCSPEAFHGQDPNELAETLELLGLWMATKDKPTRMRTLAILRAGLSRTGGSDDGLTREGRRLVP